MSVADIFILKNAVFSLGVYFILQLIVFRLTKKGEVLSWLIKVIVTGGIANVAYSVVFCFEHQAFGLPVGIAGAIFSLILYLLLSFLYTLLVFGNYESSVRLRLIREMHTLDPHGATKEEILKHYNAEMILKGRLERFINSKDLRFDGQFYHYVKKTNIFSLIDHVVNLLRTVYGASR